MSNLNSPRRQDCVVNIDDFAVASSVIKALRSSSNSNRHYKQNASRDDYLVNDISSFNRIIKDRSQEVQRHNVLEQQMNEALNNYIPPAQPMVVVNSPNERKNRQETKRSSELDSDSDDELVSSPPQHNANNSSSRPPVTPLKKDSDFDSDLDDDPEETAELMRNFIAPKTHSGAKGSGSSATGKALSYKGSSSHTSNSIKYGAGGIRGIQHASLQRSMERDDDNISVQSSTSQYTTHTNMTSNTQYSNNASKLLNIKPGQAIRVKAPNKKSRSSMNANNGNFNTIG